MPADLVSDNTRFLFAIGLWGKNHSVHFRFVVIDCEYRNYPIRDSFFKASNDFLSVNFYFQLKKISAHTLINSLQNAFKRKVLQQA